MIKSAETEKGSALEQVLRLREQANALEADARAEALDKAQRAVDDLNKLGVTYRLVEDSEPQKPSREKGVTRQKQDIPCPVCKFKTDPLHDGRLHRSQTDKKPFTNTELKERHLSKVE